MIIPDDTVSSRDEMLACDQTCAAVMIALISYGNCPWKFDGVRYLTIDYSGLTTDSANYEKLNNYSSRRKINFECLKKKKFLPQLAQLSNVLSRNKESSVS